MSGSRFLSATAATIMLSGCAQHVFKGAIDHVRVEIAEGDVEVVVGRTDRVRLHHDHSAATFGQPRIDGDTFILDYRGETTGRVVALLEVPPDADVAVNLARGRVDIDGVRGDLLVTGQVLDIAARDLGGSASTQTEAGRVALHFDDKPDDVAIELERGDATIEVPAGSYALSLPDSAMVDGVVSDDDAGCMIAVTLGDGATRLKGR